MHELADNLALLIHRNANEKITTILYDADQPPSVESIKSVTIVNPTRIHQLTAFYAEEPYGPITLLLAIDHSSRKGLIPNPKEGSDETLDPHWRFLFEGEGKMWVESTFHPHTHCMDPWINAKYKSTFVIPRKDDVISRSKEFSANDHNTLITLAENIFK